MMQYLAHVFLGIGSLFLLLGSLGVVRMPDVFNRLQAGTKATTLGFLSILVGAAIMHPLWIPKLLIMAIFLVVSAPLSSHNLARASYRAGAPMVLTHEDAYSEVEKRPKEVE